MSTIKLENEYTYDSIQLVKEALEDQAEEAGEVENEECVDLLNELCSLLEKIQDKACN